MFQTLFVDGAVGVRWVLTRSKRLSKARCHAEVDRWPQGRRQCWRRPTDVAWELNVLGISAVAAVLRPHAQCRSASASWSSANGGLHRGAGLPPPPRGPTRGPTRACCSGTRPTATCITCSTSLRDGSGRRRAWRSRTVPSRAAAAPLAPPTSAAASRCRPAGRAAALPTTPQSWHTLSRVLDAAAHAQFAALQSFLCVRDGGAAAAALCGALRAPAGRALVRVQAPDSGCVSRVRAAARRLPPGRSNSGREGPSRVNARCIRALMIPAQLLAAVGAHRPSPRLLQRGCTTVKASCYSLCKRPGARDAAHRVVANRVVANQPFKGPRRILERCVGRYVRSLLLYLCWDRMCDGRAAPFFTIGCSARSHCPLAGLLGAALGRMGN